MSHSSTSLRARAVTFGAVFALVATGWAAPAPASAAPASAARAAATPHVTPVRSAASADQAPIEVQLRAQDDARWIGLGQSVHYTYDIGYNTFEPVGIAPVGGNRPVACPDNVCRPTDTGSYVVTGLDDRGTEPVRTLLTVGDPDGCVVTGPQRTCTHTFGAAGEYPFTVPSGVDTLHLTAIGGDGGSQTGGFGGGDGGPGGHGAVVTDDLAVTAGQSYFFVVGGYGHLGQGRQHGPAPSYNGGGQGAETGASGGGATDVRTHPTTEPVSATSDPRILVAGGGGGSGSYAAGGDAGVNGADSTNPAETGGTAGTATDPGAPGGDGNCYGCGASYFGGNFYFDGAGGGGGVHGGGYGEHAGAGGGSSRVPSGGVLKLNLATSAPLVRVLYTEPTPPPQLFDDLPGTTASAGQDVHFHVAIPQDGPTIDGYTYSIAPTTGVSCTGATCTATRTGIYTVTATKGDSVLTLTYQVVPGDPVGVVIRPGRSVVASGTSIVFAVVRQDRFGNDAGFVAPAPDDSNALRQTLPRLPTTGLCDGFRCDFSTFGTWDVSYTDATGTYHAAVTATGGPTIKATVRSSVKPQGGWYPGAVTVSYTCTPGIGKPNAPCPSPDVLRKTGTFKLDRLYGTQYGDVHAVTTVRVDLTPPVVQIRGVKAGATYTHSPTITCSAADVGSGVASCHLTRTRSGRTVKVAALARDVAGNISRAALTYYLRG